MRTKPVLAAAVLAAALLLAACGSSGSDAGASDPGSGTGSGEQTTTTQEEPGDGSITMPVEPVELPADFPESFALPEGATLTEASTVGVDGTSFYATATVDDAEAAFEAYKTQVQEAGYEVLGAQFTPSDQGGYGGFSARGTDVTAAVTFGPDPTGTFSTLTVNLAPAT